MTLLRGLLVLSLSCLQGPCSVFSPVSAMEPLDQQVMGDEVHSIIGQAQEKLSPLALLKLGNQEPGGLTALKRSPGDCKGAPTREETRRLAQAIMSFTADLFSLVAQSSTSPNLILSPLSVALALSHLALGAQNQTLQSLQQVLHADSGSCLPHLLSHLCQNLGPGTFRLAARMYLQKGFWRTKFDPSLTQRDSFHLDEQFTVPVDMMQAHSYPLRWFLLEQPEIQVAHFPFKNNMSFVVMVPTHFEWNVSQILANLSWDTLHQPLLRERPTKVRLPKLHLKHHLDLVTTLSQLGLQELFQSPDLRGISDERLVVSSVQHQSTLELSEAGVEAAAATSTAMSRMSLSSFSVNRPFLFFILEDTTGLPLFVGSVRNPNPGAQPELQEQQDSPDNRDSFQDQKAFLHRDKPFGPDLKLMPPSEEDYSEFNSPK
ncbi:alpha-2-antiplasmin isoform X4 [Marmota marmota marmota]|uniref:alpha-2-antiplasmin isoform X4 n=1 Tax=Marmota marmota marmota TaxID=9994 RepID=UPI002092B23B|nr:alpha-2-antiplasmin isoform X4 [Marmota marmota marmota]